MKKRVLLILTLALLSGILLTACAAPAAVVEEPVAEEEVAEEPVVEEEPVAEEPAEEEPAAEEPVEEAADLDTPTAAFLGAMSGYNMISVEALNEALAENRDLFLLDVRETAELEENGYIEGAVHIPIRELGKNIDKLPSFDTPIVVYCGSGWRSALAMTELGILGFTDVKSMSGGFTEWVNAGYAKVDGVPEAAAALNEAQPDPALLAAVDAALSGLPEGWGVIDAAALNEELIETPDLVLIDVRRPDEIEANGYIENALQIPLEQFVEMMDQWPAKDANIVVYCAKGARGNMAAAILRTYGYTNVRNLKGGFTAWAAASLPVVGGLDLDTPTAAFLGAMSGYNMISVEALNEALVENPDLFLLDVRETAELEEKGYIEGAVHIPIRELGKNIDKLPSFDTPIVVYCGSGWRSALAMTELGILGFTDVKSMSGGFTEWVNAGYAKVDGVPEAAAVLNEAQPDAALLAAVDAALSGLPEGWGIVEAAALNEELIDGAELVLIDVRTSEEVIENGHVENALLIPLEQFIEMKGEWPAKDANIVVYCAKGGRGNIAAAILRTYGYTNVRNLKGGFTAWVEAGLPVVTD